jgi:hypothetical protein
VQSGRADGASFGVPCMVKTTDDGTWSHS